MRDHTKVYNIVIDKDGNIEKIKFVEERFPWYTTPGIYENILYHRGYFGVFTGENIEEVTKKAKARYDELNIKVKNK